MTGDRLPHSNDAKRMRTRNTQRPVTSLVYVDTHGPVTSL